MKLESCFGYGCIFAALLILAGLGALVRVVVFA